MPEAILPEPWLRGTLKEVPAVHRAVLHALELAEIDLHHWCDPLTNDEFNQHYDGIAPVAFHLRHIARSIDRLLTYAEGRALDQTQIAALKSESEAGARRDEVFADLDASLTHAAERIRAIDPGTLETTRVVGAKKLQTSVGGLLVHVADHTQRHVGQAITTAKFVRALRKS
jgi:uncharacterized damage-inducible protein DinB